MATSSLIPSEFQVNHKIEPVTMVFLAAALFFVFSRKK